MSYLKDREIWLSKVPTGNPPAGYFWKFIQNGKVVVRDSSGNDQMMIATNGSQAITGSLIVTGGITGTVSSASYVEYSNVANKPTLVSGSGQISFNGITNKPTLVSGSSQVTFLGLTGIPSGIISGSSQVAQFGYATTGSNGFNGSQSITGSLTVTGQVIAQTLNVQQVTSSIVFSSGSNVFGNNSGNTQQFTGSLQVSGSSHYLLGNVGIGTTSPTNPLHIQSNTLSQLNVTALSGNTNAQINLEPTGTGIALIGPANNVDLAFRTNATIKLRLDKDGNLGLGVTPSAWRSTDKVLQINNSSLFDENGTNLWLGLNFYENSAGSYIFNNNGYATAYRQQTGQHNWFISTISGTAGNAISFTQAMTLNASGNLSVGNTNDTYKLDVSGTGRFTGTLTVNHSTAGAYGAIIYNTSSTGEGLTVRGGSTSSHSAFVVQPYDGSVSLLNILASGPATFSSSVTSLAASPLVASVSSNSSNDAVVAARWTSGLGMEMRYNPNSAVGFIQNTYPVEINQLYGDIQFRHSVSDTMTPRMIIKGYSGNVGIGTDLPINRLHIATATNADISIRLSDQDDNEAFGIVPEPNSGNGKLYFMARSGYNTAFNSATDAKITMRTNGNVGIGTTNPVARLQVSNASDFTAILKVSDLGTESTGIIALGDGNSSALNVGIWRGAANSLVTYGNWLNLGGYDGVLFSTGAAGIGSQTERMRITSDGNIKLTKNYEANASFDLTYAFSANDSARIRFSTTSAFNQNEPGELSFWTRANDAQGGGAITERMRITSGGDQINYGNIFLNQTAVGTVNANATSIGVNGIYYMNRGSGAGLSHVIFSNGGNIVGSITSNTTNTQFNTSSDYRLKKDLKDFNALDILSNIKLYDFAWKLNNSRMYGVLAHELKELIPYTVVGEKDEIDENGNIIPQGVDYSLITPILAKAIQEQQTLIESLKSRIEILEQ